MADIDIEAIRQRVNEQRTFWEGYRTNENAPLPHQITDVLALLDAYEAEQAKGETLAELEQLYRTRYEAEHARAERMCAGLNRANNQCTRYFDRMAAAEGKLTAISDLCTMPENPLTWVYEIGEDLASDVLDIINPPAAVPEETPTEQRRTLTEAEDPLYLRPRPKVTDLMAALEASLIRATAPPEPPEEPQA